MTSEDALPKSQRFLRGLRVLEIGDGLAGAAATAALQSLGADVTTIVDGRTSHRRAQPSLPLAGDTEWSLLSLLLDRGKTKLEDTPTTLSDLEDLVEGGPIEGPKTAFDLVVVDRVSHSPHFLIELRNSTSYVSWVEAVNPRAWLSISAYGLSGPRADDFATEMTLSAASGIMCSVSDPDTGHPLKLAGNQSLLSSAQAAALAACHAIDLARGVHSVHLDASAQEATIAMGPILDLIQQHLNCQSGMGAKRYGAPASFYQCMDGLIRISAMEDHQWQGVMRAMGSPAWALRFNEAESRIEFSEELDKGVARWTARQTKADAETKLQAAGVPATAMYRPAEILESPQMAHRGTLRSFEVGDGVQVRAVGLPFLDTHDISDGSVGARPSGIRGLRVLEASHVLAVPLAGALLGALGADVTKVEDVNRLDMYRRRGPYIDGEVGINRSAYFAMVNHSKSSFTFNSEDDDRAIESLIDEADVFIENVGARRLARFGLSEVYEGAHLNRLAVSSSGFGNTGPQAHYRAYAYNLQASCGLGYLTRNDAGEPAEIDMPWADLLSGYALATIVAAWAVGPEGNEGRVIDFAMSELIDARFNEFLAAASIDPASDETVDRANAVSPFAPSGVYQSADGWIAISVDGDEAFSDLVRVLDLDPTRMERFATRECRQALRRELNEVLSDAFVKRTVAQWRELLREVDVFTERVAQTTDLFEDEHLESRGFFGEVVHPEWGRRRLIGIPWRMAGGPAVELAYPPLLAPSSSVRPKANQRAQEEAR